MAVGSGATLADCVPTNEDVLGTCFAKQHAEAPMANNDQDADRQDRLNQDTREDQTNRDSNRESRSDSLRDSAQRKNPGTEWLTASSDDEDMDESEDDRDDDARSEGGSNRRRSIS
jgi:hypothetical protein